jgi:hypothetical protein
MALDTIPKQEGGKLKAVASGTLPSGQPVIVNADGTVSVVAETAVSQSVGASTVFQSGNTESTSAAYDANAQRVVVAYLDEPSQLGKAVVGTVSGTSISFGTPVTFQANNIINTSTVYDSNAQKIVIAYQDGVAEQGKAVVGTVSGTSISFGSAATFDSTARNFIETTYDSGAQKIVIAYTNSNAHGKAVVGTVSGTSISFGSIATIYGSTTMDISIAYDSNAQKSVISYRAHANSGYGTSIVGTISGTNISFGSAVVFESAAVDDTETVYDSNAQKIVVFYQDEGNSDYGTAIVGTVSGTSISFGTAVVFESAAIAETAATYDSNAQKVVIAYRDGGNSNKGTLAVGTVSGTSISFGTPVVFETGATYKVSATYDSNAQRVVVAYRDNNDSLNGKAAVFRNAYTSINLTSENYIGVSGGVVAVTSSASQVIGSETDFDSGNRTDVTSVVYDSNSQKIVIAYSDDGNSSYGTAVVATVSGTTISFGTPVVFDTVALARVESSFDSSSNKIVICYQDNTGNTGKAVVGTVSGTSISFGTPVTFNNQSTNHPSIAYDVNANKTVIVYRDPFNSSYGTAIVGTVSGTSISFGSEFVFESATTREPDVIYDPVAQKLIIAYGDEGNSYAATAVIGTVSGSSISFGTPVVFDSGGTDLIALVYDVEANATVVFYRPISESYSGAAIVGTVSGTSISFGTKQAYDSDEVREFAATYDSVAKRAVLGYRDTGNSEKGTIISVEVSGTTMTFSTPEVFSEDPRKFSAGYDAGQGKVVFSYFDEVQNSGRSCVVQVGYEDITRGQVASGGNATVDIVGTVSTNQLSLTAGQQYFVQTDGTLGLTAADPSVLAGTAISATKLIVKT